MKNLLTMMLMILLCVGLKAQTDGTNDSTQTEDVCHDQDTSVFPITTFQLFDHEGKHNIETHSDRLKAEVRFHLVFEGSNFDEMYIECDFVVINAFTGEKQRHTERLKTFYPTRGEDNSYNFNGDLHFNYTQPGLLYEAHYYLVGKKPLGSVERKSILNYTMLDLERLHRNAGTWNLHTLQRIRDSPQETGLYFQRTRTGTIRKFESLIEKVVPSSLFLGRQLIPICTPQKSFLNL